MMYYVKQSDPNNGLLSCLCAHTCTDTQEHTLSLTYTPTHTHTRTHKSLDSLSVIELWRGSAVTTSITHPGEGWRESERKGKLGQERGERRSVCVGVRVEVVLLS